MPSTSAGEASTGYPSIEGAQCPWPFLDHLLGEEPVYQIPDRPDLYVVTRHEDVREVFRNPEVFSSFNSRSGLNGQGLLLGGDSSAGKLMIETDPPLHRAKRQIGFAPLQPRRLKRYEPKIREISDTLIDAFAGEGACEFVGAFASELPVVLTRELMGVPEEDTPWVRLWATFETSGLSWMPPEFQEQQRRNGERMQAYLDAKVTERYEQHGDDWISDVIRAQVERDGEFDHTEVRTQVAHLLGGGIVTTAHFLSNMMMLVAQHPEQADRARAEPALIPRLVEEGLRIEPSVMWVPRRVAVDTEIDGRPIPAGSYLVVLVGAANRDERKFECPHAFDSERPNAHEHLAFGQGPHFCLGAALARLEVAIAFERLLARLGDIRLAEGNDLARIPSPSFRGLKKLYIEFEGIA
jgi:hypothetical protein